MLVRRSGGDGFDGERGGQDLIRWRLGGAEEFAEEAPLGEELVFEYSADVSGFGVRFIVEVGVGEDAPGGDDLVGFTDVGVEEELVERIDSLVMAL